MKSSTIKLAMATTLVAAMFATVPCSAADPVKHNCEQPTIPITQASDMVLRYFNKRSEKYKACISKFVEEQRAISVKATDVVTANAAHDAAEAAILEYNNYMEKLNERNDNAHPEDAEDSKRDMQ